MRIVFATDIHHAFKSVEDLLARTEADITIFAGDLVSRAFYRYQTAWRFMELQQLLERHRGKAGSEASLYEVALQLQEITRDDALRDHAREYMKLADRAEHFLQRSYDRLEAIFRQFPHRAIYVLPGNYDMDLRKTSLRERNLHLETIRRDGRLLAGYGGAKVLTPGMPDHLQVSFREEATSKGIRSEALTFFRKVCPDIMALHEPPYGSFDLIPGIGHTGSLGVRQYLDESLPVRVVFSGHYHENWGGKCSGKTCFFNPSNFGKAEGVSKSRPGGYFLDLILDEQGPQVGTLRRIEKGGVRDIIDYRITEHGIDTVILDEARYARMGGTIPKVSHIRPIGMLQQIRSYFLQYETAETMELIRKLRGVYRDIAEQGMEVAFDLLGSVSFGMAEKGSDMDLVVYLRERDCLLDDLDTCRIPRPLAAVFEALEKRELNIEVCDSLDLDRIRRAIEREDKDDGHIQRFIFYRIVCRPVNLRLIKGVENLLLEKERFRKDVENGLRDYLEILVSSGRHVSSFEKYKSRLRERGIPLSPDVEEAIRHYLRG
jgi:Icc-related predicted phosphoesterase/predicted nucleotidyltransferase